MRTTLSSLSTLTVIASLVTGCVSPTAESDRALADEALVRCTEPRPQICTREYRPVCATLADGTTKTYATGCTACSDSKVVGYRPGACE